MNCEAIGATRLADCSTPCFSFPERLWRYNSECLMQIKLLVPTSSRLASLSQGKSNIISFVIQSNATSKIRRHEGPDSDVLRHSKGDNLRFWPVYIEVTEISNVIFMAELCQSRTSIFNLSRHLTPFMLVLPRHRLVDGLKPPSIASCHQHC